MLKEITVFAKAENWQKCRQTLEYLDDVTLPTQLLVMRFLSKHKEHLPNWEAALKTVGANAKKMGYDPKVVMKGI